MYNGVGISTPRGSGTSGYVQRNYAQIHGRRKIIKHTDENKMIKKKKVNKEYLEHERKKKIEVELILWLEENGYTLEAGKTQEEIDEISEKQRKEIEKKLSDKEEDGEVIESSRKNIREHSRYKRR